MKPSQSRMSILVLGLLLCPVAAGLRAADGKSVPQLTLSAPRTIEAASAFDLDVRAVQVPLMAGFEVGLDYDPTQLAVMDITPGSFLGLPDDESVTRWWLPDPEEANGDLDGVVCVRVGDTHVSGSGTLFTVRFQDIGEGARLAAAIAIDVDRTLFAGRDGRRIAVETGPDAVVTVLGDADGDGLPDRWEWRMLGTLSETGVADTDGDGESNAVEWAQGTDPADARSVGATGSAFTSFRFELFRNGLQTETGDLIELESYGALAACLPPAPDTTIRSGSMRFPDGHHEALPLEQGAADGRAVISRTGLRTLADLQAAFPHGVYTILLDTVTAERAAREVRLKVEVPAYGETDFPVFPRVLFPACNAVGVGRNPLVCLADTVWSFLALCPVGGVEVYRAGQVDPPTRVHRVADELEAGRIYHLVVDSAAGEGTCLGSRTWLGFTTATDTLEMTMAVSPDGAGQTVPPSGSAIECAAFTGVGLRGRAETGWQFLHWTGEPEEVVDFGDANALQTSVALAGDAVVTAVFVPLDSDADGMPDAWETAHGLDPANGGDAALDADGDGLSNAKEYALGTSPLRADTDADGCPDGWEAAYGLDPSDPADGAGDGDLDGLTAVAEYRAHTDPTVEDSDGDGMVDGWEMVNRLDPLAPEDALLDPDGDGQTNGQEYAAGTDPWSRGLSPGWALISLRSDCALPVTECLAGTGWVWHGDSGMYRRLAPGAVLQAWRGCWVYVLEPCAFNVRTGEVH